jgi:hypothetical protein
MQAPSGYFPPSSQFPKNDGGGDARENADANDEDPDLYPFPLQARAQARAQDRTRAY